MWDPRIHRALDGELPLDELPPEERAVVERLRTAASLLRELPPSARADLALESRVMAALRRRPSLGERVGRWLAEPRTLSVRLRPAWSLAVAVSVGAVLLARGAIRPVAPGPGKGVVEFVAPFPAARSVTVAGSFNDWQPERLRLADGDHDGVWRATAVLPSGTHEYMFVIDGERWVPDPLGERYVDDGYGRQNTLLVVREGSFAP